MIKLVFVLNVIDEVTYREYRKMIKPLMDNLGIKVLNEYRIADVVHSDSVEDQVNLLAVFGFPSDDVKKQFFENKTYLKAKKLFNASTEHFTKIIE